MKWFALLAALFLSAASAEIQRCEAPDGKVTYSNESCPPGTSAVKKIDTRPAVTEADAKAAKTRAQRDTDEVKATEKQREAEEKSRARAREAARKKDEQLERECNKKRVAVNTSRDAVDSAALNKRDEMEKKRARAQESFDKDCAGR